MPDSSPPVQGRGIDGMVMDFLMKYETKISLLHSSRGAKICQTLMAVL